VNVTLIIENMPLSSLIKQEYFNMAGIKIFECAICKQLYFNNVKGEVRFYGTRKDVREHLKKIHHINRKAKFYNEIVGHKGNRGIKMGKMGKFTDNRSKVTQNCILYKEF
jgi:hypothetical protein